MNIRQIYKSRYQNKHQHDKKRRSASNQPYQSPVSKYLSKLPFKSQPCSLPIFIQNKHISKDQSQFSYSSSEEGELQYFFQDDTPECSHQVNSDDKISAVIENQKKLIKQLEQIELNAINKLHLKMMRNTQRDKTFIDDKIYQIDKRKKELETKKKQIDEELIQLDNERVKLDRAKRQTECVIIQDQKCYSNTVACLKVATNKRISDLISLLNNQQEKIKHT